MDTQKSSVSNPRDTMKLFKPYTLAILLVFSAFTFSAFTLTKMEHVQTTDQNVVLTSFLLDRVKECVQHNQEISHKEDIFSLIGALAEQGYVSESGSDDLRIKYVHTQAAIEHVLASALVLHEIDYLVGVIHTPTPATPLCTQVDHLDEQLLDASIRDNPEKLLTIRSRAVIVREYLERGGQLFIAYPQGGLEKRTLEQQQIYKEALAKYADRLFDTTLSCDKMDPSKVGATYLFKSSSGDIYAFSIKANQANSPEMRSEWGLWFGKIEDQAIHQRIDAILDYLAHNGGPHLTTLYRYIILPKS